MEKNHLSMPHLKVDCSDQKTDFFFPGASLVVVIHNRMHERCCTFMPKDITSPFCLNG